MTDKMIERITWEEPLIWNYPLPPVLQAGLSKDEINEYEI